MIAYYNEIDPFCAQWLRNLIAVGHLPPGDVDERDIREVQGDDVRGYHEAHFFAGIGGWPYALRLAEWPDDRPVWTGSCPCQPLSSAGRRQGHADERHLWPAFHCLIAECRPATVLGEQVASKDGREWFAGVRADLEALGYACGAADLCAAGVGAPHIRQRLWWVADHQHHGQRQLGHGLGSEARSGQGEAGQRERLRPAAVDGGATGVLAKPEHGGREGRDARRRGSGAALPSGEVDGVADLSEPRRDEQPIGYGRTDGRPSDGEPSASPLHGVWRDADWLLCRDGKWRPVEPGTFPLAHGIPGRVGRLRGYGNAIVPQVAAEFIAAFMECRP